MQFVNSSNPLNGFDIHEAGQTDTYHHAMVSYQSVTGRAVQKRYVVFKTGRSADTITISRSDLEALVKRTIPSTARAVQIQLAA